LTVKSLRSRLIVSYVVATLVPLAATVWVTIALIDRSLGYATTQELDRVSKTLERAVRQFYQRERDALRQDALAGRVRPGAYDAGAQSTWPEPVRAFWESGETERFDLSGDGGDRLNYLRRQADGVTIYRRDLGVRMQELSREFSRTRDLVRSVETRDLRRGFTLTLLVLLTLVWLLSLIPIVYLSHRITAPIRQLTKGLTAFADGDWNRRVTPVHDDDVGRAVDAFNRMAGQWQKNRERLVYLTQMSSWQSLARKTAHELKNSLTPIRLTVEEMAARQAPADRAFVDQAVQIVVSEIQTLERRVRAFSELSSEPSVVPERLDLNALCAERVAFLRSAHPLNDYRTRFASPAPCAWAGGDLVKGILTNLIENAAEAAGAQGTILVITAKQDTLVEVQVHDSGPGLSSEAASTLFAPTITFKVDGMGLGLSIAKMNALLCGGDIEPMAGELGGAAFRVTLPRAGAQAGFVIPDTDVSIEVPDATAVHTR
jgi:nitrogen fixation/metabolism regulation signal transduction histidine kinase